MEKHQPDEKQIRQAAIEEEEKIRTEARIKTEKEIKKKEDEKKVKWGCMGCLGILALFFLAVILFGGSNDNEGREMEETPHVEEGVGIAMGGKEYLTEVIGIAEVRNEALDEIVLILEGDDWVKIYYDTPERNRLIVNMAIVKLSYESVTRLTPPEEMEEVHELVLKAFDKSSQAMTIYADWMDNKDEDMLAEAGQLMRESSELWDEAGALLRELLLPY
jgi:hypothetical protein